MAKMICPKCGLSTFATTAHVAQTWEVDGDGNFLEVLEDCTDVIAKPNTDNVWQCMKCGAEAVNVTEDDRWLATDIEWEVDDDDALDNLPSWDVLGDMDEEEVVDALSDQYGFLISGLCIFDLKEGKK